MIRLWGARGLVCGIIWAAWLRGTPQASLGSLPRCSDVLTARVELSNASLSGEPV